MQLLNDLIYTICYGQRIGLARITEKMFGCGVRLGGKVETMLIANILLALLELLSKRSEQKRTKEQEHQKSVVINVTINNNTNK